MVKQKDKQNKEDNIVFHNTDEIKPYLKQIIELVHSRLKKDSAISPLLLLIIGILNRTYELTESVIWSIENSRPLTTIHIIRGLQETLGYIYYWKQKIEFKTDVKEREKEIKQALLGSRRGGDQYQQVNILTCIDKATQRFPELRKSYDDISEAVHPNSASHFYIGRPIEEKTKKTELKIPFYQFKGNDKKALINQTGECCGYIIQICRRLIDFS